jgi:branched-chain amino acid transport system substrate-binding protein
MRMRVWTSRSVGWLMAFLLALPATAFAFGDEIVVGAMMPLTKKGASYGVPQRASLDIAIEEINAKGGIQGRKMRAIVMDTEGNEAVGVQAAQKLIQREKVIAIVGPAWSSVTEAVFPVCKREKIPCFSPTSTKPGISEPHRPWSFRNSKNEDLLIPETMAWVMDHWKPKTAAILTDIKDSYSKDLGKRTFPNVLRESGVEVVADLDYQTGDTDFSAIVTNVKAANPDIICLGSTWPEAANFMKEAAKQGLIKPYVCGVGCNNERLIDNAGQSAENTVMNVIFNPFVDDEQVKHYVAEFKKKAPDESLSWAWATYYDVPKMIAWAIERAGIENSAKSLAADREKVRTQLDQLKDYAGITGLTTIDTKTGDAIKASTLLLIKDGKFTVVGQGEAKRPEAKK